MSAVLSLSLSHLRSYRGAEIATAGRSVALFGPNGAGKTNLMEAVSLLVPGRGLRRAPAEALIRRPEAIGWRVRARVDPGDGEPVEVVTGASDPTSPRRTVHLDEQPVPQLRLGRLLRMVWMTPAMDRLWTEGASDRRRFLDRMVLGFEPDHGSASLDYEKAMRDRNRLLREPGPDPAWLDALEDRMARSGARIARNRAVVLARIEAAAQNANTLFPKADLAILGAMESRFAEMIRAAAGTGATPAAQAVEIPVENQDSPAGGAVSHDREAVALDGLEAEECAGLARALRDGRGRDAAAGRALTGPHRSDLEAVYAAKAMPAAACSTGEQKALLISLCLANARALTADGPAPVLLFDEIAAHLDAGRRRALYAEIAGLGAQAWMTGTAPELFDGLEGALHVAVREHDGASVLEPIA